MARVRGRAALGVVLTAGFLLAVAGLSPWPAAAQSGDRQPEIDFNTACDTLADKEVAAGRVSEVHRDIARKDCLGTYAICGFQNAWQQGLGNDAGERALDRCFLNALKRAGLSPDMLKTSPIDRRAQEQKDAEQKLLSHVQILAGNVLMSPGHLSGRNFIVGQRVARMIEVNFGLLVS